MGTILHRIMNHIKNHINLQSLIRKKGHISKKNHTRKKNHISKRNHIKKKNHIRKKSHIRKKNHTNLKNHIKKKSLTNLKKLINLKSHIRKKLKKTHIIQMIPMNLTHTNHQKAVMMNITTIDRPDHTTVGQYDGCGDGVLDIHLVMVYSLWSWVAGHGSLDLNI